MKKVLKPELIEAIVNPEYVQEEYQDLILIDNNQFGLELSKAEQLKKEFAPHFIKLIEYKKEFEEVLKMDLEDPKTGLKAAELRKRYMKNRTATAELHRKEKTYALAFGKYCDAIKNKQAEISEEKEEKLRTIETHLEEMEKKRVDDLKRERIKLVMPYLNQHEKQNIDGFNLGSYTQDFFDNYLLGVKTNFEFLEAAKKAEQKAKEAREKLEIESKRIAKELAEKMAKEKAELEREIAELKAQKLRAEQEEKERSEAREDMNSAWRSPEVNTNVQLGSIGFTVGKTFNKKGELESADITESLGNTFIGSEQSYDKIALENFAAYLQLGNTFIGSEQSYDKIALENFAAYLQDAIDTYPFEEIKTEQAKTIEKQTVKYITNTIEYLKTNTAKL